MGRAEEVGAHDAVRSARLLADDRDVDSRGIGGQDAVWTAGLLQIRKDALLQTNILKHSFHDLAGQSML